MITVVGNKPVMRRGDNEIGVVGDNLGKTLEFSIDRIQGAIDLNDYSAWALIERSAPNGGASYSTMVTKSTVGDKITISLPITSNETKDYGYVYASIKFATANVITAFANYGSTVGGTVKATSANHGLDWGVTTGVVISGTTNYNGTYNVVKIDANNFYFAATWVSDQTGWWGVSPIWQTERVMLKVAKGINGETEAEALETNIFDAQVAAFQAAIDVLDLTNYEHTDNKITSISASSTDGEYPSGKAVWEKVQDFSSTSSNTYLGYVSGVGSSSQDSVGVGAYALNSLTSGISNTSVGSRSLSHNTTGYQNTAIGRQALSGNVTGYDNVAVGAFALELSNSAIRCIGIGSYALNKNTSYHNSALGFSSLRYNTSGYQNSGFGGYALEQCTTGVNNTGVGFYSLRANTTGQANTVLGAYSLYRAVGSYNTVVGAEAAQLKATSNDCVYIGYNCQALQDATVNEIVIGSGANGAGTNTVTLGNTNISSTVLRGDVKIGTKITASNGTDPAVGITATAGDSSTKLATTAFVQGEISGIFGEGTTAIGENSSAFGYGNHATGNRCFAINMSNEAIGDNSFACGFSTQATGLTSFSCGILTRAEGNFSFAAGNSTTAIEDNSAGSIFGTYGETTEDTLFAVANGTGVDDKSLALNVESDKATWTIDVFGVTQAAGDNSGKFATTEYVMGSRGSAAVKLVQDSYNILESDEIVFCDGWQNPMYTVALPHSAVGKKYTIKSVDAEITINPYLDETIDGDDDITIDGGTAIEIVCYSSGKWAIISRYTP